MYTSQKLELSAGIATSASVLGWLFILIGTTYSDANFKYFLSVYGIYVAEAWLISLMVAGGAYYDAKKQSRAAGTVLAVGVCLIIAISGVIGLFILMYRGENRFFLIAFTPAILAALTGISARFARR